MLFLIIFIYIIIYKTTKKVNMQCEINRDIKGLFKDVKKVQIISDFF